MDSQKLVEFLRGTIDPNQRQQAEQQLEQIQKIIGFTPALLNVVMMNNLDMPVRQAGVIYFKNMILPYWEEKEAKRGEAVPFNIHEQDRAMIRDAIVDAVVHAPDCVRSQLAVCLSHIIKHDFPGRWTGLIDKISIYIQSPDRSGWLGSLICMYQLVFYYEFRDQSKRKPLNEALKLLLPLVFQRLAELLPDESEHSVLIQKTILKIFYSYVQYFLCLDIVTFEVFDQWMIVAKVIIQRPVPEVTNTIDEDERVDLVWWKCKKWAVRFVTRMFERYGSPGKVDKQYEEFSKHHLKTYVAPMLEIFLRILDDQRKKIYVSPRVLQLVMFYIKESVSHATAWKLVRPHILGIIQDVVFPLMCYQDEDEELWQTDPYEFIHMKFDLFSELTSPVTAAQKLIHQVAEKRKDMLQKIMMMVREVINSPEANPRHIDGALHIAGTVSDLMLKKKAFKDQMEPLLVTYIVPLFHNPHPYLRARACWMVQYLSKVTFQNDANLVLILKNIEDGIITNQDLPVKVLASISLHMLLVNQKKVADIILPRVQNLTMHLLKILRESEIDEVTTVVQTIVRMFAEHLTPLAVEITKNMAATFDRLLNNEDQSEDKVITGIGILSTLELVISKFEKHPQVLANVESIIVEMLKLIIRESLFDFYEEAFELVCTLTCEKISPNMWTMFEMMYECFQTGAFDYFVEMMPALHNFVTVDPPVFLSNEKNLLAIFNMCKVILSETPGEDTECHACKLLEVTLLQFKGQIDSCVPSFVEVALERLTREVKTSELRTMCLQVVVAALYYNPSLLFDTLEKIKLPNTTESITSHFIKQWLHDTDCFAGLHDRKLSVLGLCELIRIPPNRLPVISECSQQILPSLIMLFSGLKTAYAERAEDSDDEYEESDSDDEDPGLASDEDDLGTEDEDYLRRLANKARAKCPFPVTMTTVKDPENGEEDKNLSHLYEDDDDDDDDEEVSLEIYATPLDENDCPVDEYVVFKDTLQRIQESDPNWYNLLTHHLNENQKKAVSEIFILSDLRRAAAQSKQIEKSGGYSFQNKTVPSSFNFSSP